MNWNILLNNRVNVGRDTENYTKKRVQSARNINEGNQ
jgi:hypothetical protein